MKIKCESCGAVADLDKSVFGAMQAEASRRRWAQWTPAERSEYMRAMSMKALAARRRKDR